jgi:hypothetical protein
MSRSVFFTILSWSIKNISKLIGIQAKICNTHDIDCNHTFNFLEVLINIHQVNKLMITLNLTPRSKKINLPVTSELRESSAGRPRKARADRNVIPISMRNETDMLMLDLICLMCGVKRAELFRKLLEPHASVIKAILKSDGYISELGTPTASGETMLAAYNPKTCSDAVKLRNHRAFLAAESSNKQLAFSNFYREDKIFIS